MIIISEGVRLDSRLRIGLAAILAVVGHPGRANDSSRWRDFLEDDFRAAEPCHRGLGCRRDHALCAADLFVRSQR